YSMSETIGSSGFGISIAPLTLPDKKQSSMVSFWLEENLIFYPGLESELIQCINLKNEGKENE
ncbi:secretion protein EspT, partial [Escherichia coli]